jgi:glutamate/aspartate transport system permease protein
MGALDFSGVLEAAPYLLSGLQFTLALTAVTFVVGMTLGTLLATIQQLEVPVLSQAIRVYVALIRSVPLILVLFWFFFLVPLALGHLFAGGRPIPIGASMTAFVTFGLFEAAYYSEIMRVGFRSVGRGQFEAAKALALPTLQVYRQVIIPQVLKVAAPIILTQTIILFQDTSLVYVLSLTDLLGAASKLAQLNGQFVEFYLSVALVYLVISSSASQLVSRLKRQAA